MIWSLTERLKSLFSNNIINFKCNFNGSQDSDECSFVHVILFLCLTGFMHSVTAVPTHLRTYAGFFPWFTSVTPAVSNEQYWLTTVSAKNWTLKNNSNITKEGFSMYLQWWEPWHTNFLASFWVSWALLALLHQQCYLTGARQLILAQIILQLHTM